MADEPNNNSDSSDTWIWVAGGIIALSLLGNAARNVNEFIFEEEVQSETMEQVEDVGADDRFVNQDGWSNSEAGQVRSQEVVSESDRDLIGKISDGSNSFLASFSLFKSAPGLVWFSAIVTFLGILIIIYSSLRRFWIIKQWDQDIGAVPTDEPESGLLSSNNNTNDRVGNMIKVDPDDSAVDEATSPKPEPENNKITPEGQVVTDFQQRWEGIVELAKTNDEASWRQAIIEADILLGELLTQIGYEGKTIAERLQEVRRIDMHSIEDAWQAHKVRNRIAHEGSQYELDKETFKQTLAKFERVFEEARMI